MPNVVISPTDAMVPTADSTFEATLFNSALTIRRTGAAKDDVNVISPVNTEANYKAIANAQVMMQDHDDDSSIPVGSIQVVVKKKPTADLKYRLFTMNKNKEA